MTELTEKNFVAGGYKKESLKPLSLNFSISVIQYLKCTRILKAASRNSTAKTSSSCFFRHDGPYLIYNSLGSHALEVEFARSIKHGIPLACWHSSNLWFFSFESCRSDVTIPGLPKRVILHCQCWTQEILNQRIVKSTVEHLLSFRWFWK